MKLTEARTFMRVAYIRFNGEKEYGKISSWNTVNIFVKFDKQVEKLGWEGTTSQSCDPNDLEIVH